MLDLVELKKLCDEYDAEYGMYPESDYEGNSIYEFAVERAAKAVEANPEQPTTAPAQNGESKAVEGE